MLVISCMNSPVSGEDSAAFPRAPVFSFQGLDEDGQQPYALGPWRSDRGERDPTFRTTSFFQYVETIHGFLPISPENMARNMVYSLWYYIQDIAIMDICDYIYM